jgi:hypothetical protein
MPGQSRRATGLMISQDRDHSARKPARDKMILRLIKEATFFRWLLRLLTNPIIFGGVFHFAVLKSSFLHSYLTMVSSWISRTIRRRNKLRR